MQCKTPLIFLAKKVAFYMLYAWKLNSLTHNTVSVEQPGLDISEFENTYSQNFYPLTVSLGKH